MNPRAVAKNMSRTIREFANLVELSNDFEDLFAALYDLKNEVTYMSDEAYLMVSKQRED